MNMAEGKWKRIKYSLPVLSNEKIECFATDYPDVWADITDAFNYLLFGDDRTGMGYLGANKLCICNAAYSRSFSNCACEVEMHGCGVRFSHVLGRGTDVLFDFLQNNVQPKDGSIERKALGNLLSFFAYSRETLLEATCAELEDEATTCLFLINHLVDPLSAYNGWKMDIRSEGKLCLMCPCGTDTCPRKHPVLNDYDDLSIGNKKVWHGSVDAMTLTEVPVVILGVEGDDGEKEKIDSSCAVDFKKTKFKFKDKGQLYAETIVYSFLQRKFNKSVHFVPVLGLTNDSIIVSMYDAELDVLLSTPETQFVGVDKRAINMGILMVWLTCNYKLFSTPLSQKALELVGTKKAEFEKFVKEKLSIYKDDLKFQGVGQKEHEIAQVLRTDRVLMSEKLQPVKKVPPCPVEVKKD